MTDWIKIDENDPKTWPEHEQLVCVYHSSGTQGILTFLITEAVDNFLKIVGIDRVESPYLGLKYVFTSIEVPGNCLRGVTHWKPIGPPPKECMQ